MNINLKAMFNVTQVLSPRFRSGASIVNLSSLAGQRAFPEHALYHLSKAGVDAVRPKIDDDKWFLCYSIVTAIMIFFYVNQLTRSLALEFGPRNIRVNSVNPTACMTEMGREVWSDKAKSEALWSRIPLYRFAELHEVVDPILFLLGNQSSFISGHSLPIEGGFSAC